MGDAFLATLARLKSQLPRKDLDLLAGSCENTTTAPAHRDVFRPGFASHLHILQEGWACKYQLLPNGRRQIMSIHLAGEVLDLDRINNPNPPVNVLALSDCRVARVPLEWIRKTIDERPTIRDLFWRLTTLENHLLNERIVSLGSRTARERVAHLLCDLLERLQALGEALDGSFRSYVNQGDLADALGLSVVHLNRTLQSLKADGLLSTRGRHYSVHDLKRLQKIAMLDGAAAAAYSSS